MAEYTNNAQYQTTKDFEEKSVNFRDLFSYCLANWYWFLIALILTLGTAFLYMLKTQPVYLRNSSILIKKDDNSHALSDAFGQFSDIGQGSVSTNVFNEMLSLKSKSYIVEVVKILHLEMDYSINGPYHDYVLYGKSLPVEVSLLDFGDDDTGSLTMEIGDNGNATLYDFQKNGNLKTSTPIKAQIGSIVQTPIGRILLSSTKSYTGKYAQPIFVNRQSIKTATDRYSNALSVDLNNDRSSVVDLKIEDVSPTRAEDILNTIFLVYNQKWIEDINKQAVSTERFINDELRQIENDLGSVDADISSYKSKNLIPDVKSANDIYMMRSETTNSKLLELNNQLYLVKYIQRQLSSNPGKYSLLPPNSGIENPSITHQISAYNETVLQRNSLIANSSVKNPLIADLDKNLNAMREAISASLNTVVVSLNDQINSLYSNERETRTEIAENPSREKYILSVERQQKVKEQIYIFLLQKREENQLSKAFTAYNTKMLNPPSGPYKAIKPVKLNLIVIALLLGILIPLVILLSVRTMDTAVRNRKDLEDLSIPFIGELPLSYRKYRGLLSIFNKRHKDVREIVVREKSGNVINEAFRVIRTNLEFIGGKEGVTKTVMFTSANAGSGKTFISANLSTSFAIKGKRVLLMDFDFRKASLSTFVQSPAKGIADYLSEHVDDINEVMIKGTINPNLDVLPVGTIPPNPTELLFSSRLESFIEEMKEQYDYIFIDCPPVDIVADAAIINKFCNMTIYVIRSGLYDRRMLKELEKNYQDRRFNNLTLILNGTSDDYNSYGYHRYGYGYGYGYTTKN